MDGGETFERAADMEVVRGLFREYTDMSKRCETAMK